MIQMMTCALCGEKAVLFDTSCRACGKLTPRMAAQCERVSQKFVDTIMGIITERYKNVEA